MREEMIPLRKDRLNKMLRITPNKRAIASPASTASTTGSTKSNEKRTRNNCVETEIMMWLVLEG